MKNNNKKQKQNTFTTVNKKAYVCLGNSCCSLILPSWGYRGGKSDMGSVSATSFLQCGFFPAKADACHENNIYHNGKIALIKVSQHLYNPFQFSISLQVLLD